MGDSNPRLRVCSPLPEPLGQPGPPLYGEITVISFVPSQSYKWVNLPLLSGARSSARIERRPPKPQVGGSSPPGPAMCGRSLAWTGCRPPKPATRVQIPAAAPSIGSVRGVARVLVISIILNLECLSDDASRQNPVRELRTQLVRGVGFEPTRACCPPAPKAGALDLSRPPPPALYLSVKGI